MAFAVLPPPPPPAEALPKNDLMSIARSNVEVVDGCEREARYGVPKVFFAFAIRGRFTISRSRILDPPPCPAAVLPA